MKNSFSQRLRLIVTTVVVVAVLWKIWSIIGSSEVTCSGHVVGDLPELELARGKRVLITGAAGFIGSHLAAACRDLQMSVVGIDDMSGGFQSNIPTGIRFVMGDVKDPLFLQELFRRHGPFDYVYHIAAYAAEGLSHFIRSYNYRNNLVGSVELLNTAIKNNVKTFVFTSSIAVYGTNQIPMVEETVPMPEDPYGISKYAFELDLRAAHEMFGLEYIVFRPHNVYGPNQNVADKYRNVIGIFINQILHDLPLTIFGDGMQTRAFSYIDDVAPTIARAPFIRQAKNQVFNIGADTPYTLNELSAEISRAMGVELKVKHLAKRNEVMHAQASHRKLHCMFRTGGRFTTLREGLVKTVAWVKEVGGKLNPVAFKAVEIKRKMPPSWVNSDLLEQPRIIHTAKDSNPRYVEDPAHIMEYDPELPEERVERLKREEKVRAEARAQADADCKKK